VRGQYQGRGPVAATVGRGGVAFWRWGVVGLPCGAFCRCASSSKHASLPSSSPSVAPLPPSSSSTSLGRGSIMNVALWLWYVVGECEGEGGVCPTIVSGCGSKSIVCREGDGEGGEDTKSILLDLVANLPAF